MTGARFSIGIDLGTTNSALAFAPLDGNAAAQVVMIPQWDTPAAIVDALTLPSFLYLPDKPAAAAISGQSAGEGTWVLGRLARAMAAEDPGRVAHSAKSWLCHHSADRSAAFLPWGSDALESEQKISPIGASARILGYLRDAWNDRFAGRGPDFAFDAQIVTLTVPASFDTVAQRLTLAAAAQAGFPQTVRLLEEPQAAFYRWLELHASAHELWAGLSGAGGDAPHVLVVDVGGGTSDFSLFEIHASGESRLPRIKRVAVSDHLLLGGDNMDLALAHRLEPQLVEGGDRLSGRQWQYLVARCRDVKETALSSTGAPDERFHVSIPARGSSVIAGTRSASLARAEIERLIIDGFFPECYADEGPIRTRAALGEWGLPYASDPAITRHLADFLRDRPAVGAVLFNGGSLVPRRVRERIAWEIGKWQSRPPPLVLENAEPDLAVACGAARFGRIRHSPAERIEAGTAHAVFLHADQTAAATIEEPRTHALVCVLPERAPTECTFEITDLALELRMNRPVRFQAYSSTRHGLQKAGEIIDWNERDFAALPPLETLVKAADLDREPTRQTLPVHLTVRLSELGRLEISCISADPQIRGAWPLEFNLRAQTTGHAGKSASATLSDAPSDARPNVGTDALDAAHSRIQTLFRHAINKRDKLTAARLIKSLEVILGAPKSEWNVVLVRSLWATLETCGAYREISIEHEEAWLILAGFLLRPGFGAPLDDARIDSLWTLRETGLRFAAKPVKIQEYVLWRRVSGGLSRERQESVLAPELPTIRAQNSPPPELVLLAGSFERIGIAAKTELIHRFITAASALAQEKKHYAHFLAALGLLLNRSPLYGGPETVVAPELVQHAFSACSDFEWAGPTRIELQTLFLRAARVVNNRTIDVPKTVRNRIADKLEKSGVATSKTAPLRDYVPMQRSERAGTFGESLPPGLILRAT